MGARHIKGMNGTLPITLGWNGAFQSFDIVGGPYDSFPGRDKAFGVCVRAERAPPKGFDAHVPIKDFDVPRSKADVDDAIKETLRAALEGRTVYVGCMGGWGRTGLFLALLAKTCGAISPVQFVREHYTPKAVETPEQFKYVMEFDVSELRSWLFWTAWRIRARKLLRGR